ncbi:MAG: hypothetical protein A2W25_13145 [candidate division Zixibacteria bacterium RBG_16_53_22]|nr:MAG: hypothetical protein A2W25_13145 [candidate division Zixibacteria bacterium RBG_16_53_22]
MRILIGFSLIMALMAAMAGAEDETLLSGEIEHGGFGAPVVKFTELKDEFAVLVGGRGGWIINHSFSIGGAGYGLVNQDIDERIISTDTTLFLTMGYGGVEFEYIASSEKLMHMTISSLIGGGAIDYLAKSNSRDWDHHDYHSDNADAFFVFEPAINGELNVVEFFRIGAGVSYRFISGVETEELTDNDLSGLAANIMFKFGKF